MGEGIWDRIKKQEPTGYKKLTAEMIEKFLEQITKTVTPKYENIAGSRSFKIYTGTEGAFIFNWMILYGDTIKVKYFYYRPKRIGKILYLSLFEKQGLYKLKVQGQTFTILKGTEVLKVFNNVGNQWDSSTNLYNHKNIQRRINDVNDYLKQLERWIQIQKLK